VERAMLTWFFTEKMCATSYIYTRQCACSHTPVQIPDVPAYRPEEGVESAVHWRSAALNFTGVKQWGRRIAEEGWNCRRRREKKSRLGIHQIGTEQRRDRHGVTDLG
jgi:hypothetical protein